MENITQSEHNVDEITFHLLLSSVLLRLLLLYSEFRRSFVRLPDDAGDGMVDGGARLL